jgi:hypothetical protein
MKKSGPIIDITKVVELLSLSFELLDNTEPIMGVKIKNINIDIIKNPTLSQKLGYIFA